MYNTLPGRLADESCLGARTRRAHRTITRLYDDALRPLGISLAQLDILVTLLHEGSPIRPVDLSRAMLMERSTVSRNLARLEAAGLIQLRPGDNDREQLVVVTSDGQRLVARAEGNWAEAQEAVRALLRPDGVRALELVSERV